MGVPLIHLGFRDGVEFALEVTAACGHNMLLLSSIGRLRATAGSAIMNFRALGRLLTEPRHQSYVKIAILGLLVGVSLLPLQSIRGLILERQETNNAVKDEIIGSPAPAAAHRPRPTKTPRKALGRAEISKY